ncbi:MAG: PilZ domain-containing protein [Geobacteraceae bacterium]|nr:PilZ domain-containing protein [Geobacteraceae bacterium]
MTNKRRFSRVKCIEKSIVETDSGPHDVMLHDISLKGALVEFGSSPPVREGDRLKLFFQLDHSDVVLHFEAEVVHCRENLAGVKFVEMDLDTMIHLRSLMEARTVNPEQVRHELSFLMDDE